MEDLTDMRETFVSQNENASHQPKWKYAERSKVGRQVLAVLSGGLCFLSAGFHSGWPSPTFVKLLADDSDIPITSAQGGWIIVFVMPGTLIGVILMTFITRRLGRREILLAGAVPAIIGCLLIAFAQNYQWLYVARFSLGIAWGLSAPNTLMYLGEISEDKIRGVLGAQLNSLINWGVVLVYSVGAWVDRKTLAGVGVAMQVIFVLIFFWMPESPYFLVMNKKIEEARESLIWLRGKSDVTEELLMVEQGIELEKRNSGSYRELFLSPKNRRALIIGLGVTVIQEFSGIGAITAYSQLIFKASGANIDSGISSIIIAVIQLVSGYVATFTVNIAGRRTLLLISALGISFFLSTVAVYFQLQDAGFDVSSVSWLPITGMVGYVILFTLGLGIVPTIILSEIFPCNFKEIALMMSLVMLTVGIALASQLYQVVSDAYGVHYSFWLFAGLSICSAAFVYFVVPETRNRSLQDIQNDLQLTIQRKSSSLTTRHIVRSQKLRTML